MSIYYDSKTGNTEHIAKQVCECAKSVLDLNNLPKPGEKILFLTHTTGNGELTKPAEEFVKNYGSQIIGVVSSGNVVKHPQTFGHAAVRISERLNVPIVRIVQLKGEQEDIDIIKTWFQKNK